MTQPSGSHHSLLARLIGWVVGFIYHLFGIRDQEKLAERRLEHSKFIKEYVAEHPEELAELRARATALGFQGQWCIIGDKGYPKKRLQYATTSFLEGDVSPRIILYPTGDEDVQKAIGLCRDLGMAIAVRTGGHQYCGFSSTSPANMQIDLSETYQQYDYDAATNVLRCGVSHALGDWARMNHENGIYLPMGVCAHVHLGGHVQTGGWGMVGRSYGLLGDRVLAFDIILATGEKEHIVRPVAGETTQHNDDVYYAVLGGGKGGDFGIVTHWEFEPIRDEDHPNSACYQFFWFWSEEKMDAVVSKLDEFTRLCGDGTIPSDYEFMLTITGTAMINAIPNVPSAALRELGHFVDEEPVPAMIQMWMCYTNKGGVGVPFDDRWFEAFTDEAVCGKPLLPFRLKNTPISEGLAEHFVMRQDREMEYPYVKRARGTSHVPERFADVFTERMNEMMGETGTRHHQHVISQMQIYAGGAIAENGKAGTTAFSWRDLTLAIGHDAFYSIGGHGDAGHQTAEQWQRENDVAFIGQGAFADRDQRQFAYTFGERVLDDVWACYYDSREKYDRVRRIKGELDPGGLFSADPFSVTPL